MFNDAGVLVAISPCTLQECLTHRIHLNLYLGSLLTNQNSIREEIKSRFKTGNSCYYSIQTLFFSRLFSKNLKIKIYKTIILSVVLYDSESCSLSLKAECRL